MKKKKNNFSFLLRKVPFFGINRKLKLSKNKRQMTEKELTLLGFKQEKVEEYDTDESYYYVIDIVDGITFITPTNEEIKNNEWYVEFFDTNPSIRFTEFGEVQGLINQLTKAIVK